MSEENQNLQAQCKHATGQEQQERPVKYTFRLLSSVFICVFGNSFPHGYNIGVVNSPASIIKLWYAMVNLAKKGIVTAYKDGYLYYVDAKDSALSGGNGLDMTTNQTSNTTHRSRVHVVSPDEDLMDWWWSVTVATFVLFGMIGAFVSGKIADGYGRKRGMVLASTFMILSAALGYIAKLDDIMSPVCLIMSRSFAGLHCGISISLASLYLAEIAPKMIRGAVGTVHQLFITLGLFWGAVMGLPEMAGSWESWNLCFAFNIVPALVSLLVFPLCPESPRFLLIKKRKEKDATLVLRKLRGYDNVDDEIEEMRNESEKEVTKMSLCQLFTSPELRLPLVIAVVLQVAQQWSGINAVMSYSSFIFRQANIPIDSIPYVIVGQGAVNVLATIVAIPLLEKVGRRPLLFLPMIVMAFSFIAFVICLIVLKGKDTEIANNGLAITCIILMVPYVVGFAIGLGPLPYVVVTEIFRQGPRAAAMGFAQAINWICNLTLMWMFIFIQKNVQENVYIIFATIIIGSVAFFYFYLPETKNRTFDDIADSVAYWRPKRSNMVEETGEESLPMNIGSTEQMSDNSSTSTNVNRETTV